MTQHAYAQTQKFGDKYTNFSVFFHPFLRGQLGYCVIQTVFLRIATVLTQIYIGRCDFSVQ